MLHFNFFYNFVDQDLIFFYQDIHTLAKCDNDFKCRLLQIHQHVSCIIKPLPDTEYI